MNNRRHLPSPFRKGDDYDSVSHRFRHPFVGAVKKLVPRSRNLMMTYDNGLLRSECAGRPSLAIYVFCKQFMRRSWFDKNFDKTGLIMCHCSIEHSGCSGWQIWSLATASYHNLWSRQSDRQRRRLMSWRLWNERQKETHLTGARPYT